MFKRKKTRLQIAQEKTQKAINKTNEKIEELGKCTSEIYTVLCDIQIVFDEIKNVPSEERLRYEELKKISLNWKQQADKIGKDYKAAAVKNVGTGAAGAGVGVAVVALGPTAAMGVATTFGVASTGTAIATLHGAAATNAALAWLGGGALSAGGGGIAAGEVFLGLTGPVGWAIAAVALLSSGFMFWKNHGNQKRIEEIFTDISKRDIKTYELAIVELNERIKRIKEESILLKSAIQEINKFGLDYIKMTERQQYALGSYVNLMMSSTQLLTNPILGLQPNYTEEDLDKYASIFSDRIVKTSFKNTKSLVLLLCNFLYAIRLSNKDKRLLWKVFKTDKKFLKALNVRKKDFTLSTMYLISNALNYKYRQKK